MISRNGSFLKIGFASTARGKDVNVEDVDVGDVLDSLSQ
ncbi:hypothetical protein J5U23_01400 [Saccharolobus shibatae B12]|uniref:Uncharacterized protein n=1 Tax=Saccharolobus shibatae (strain ATCC 51178 / DSM 5389 / JCM 8931 / NBRC 15437 / B12) TaxID=523848 RepID=A0A8F5GT86_SACSH|nr:hypothetical protein J5U23_01400 [Saccharolobus shibatae B12]